MHSCDIFVHVSRSSMGSTVNLAMIARHLREGAICAECHYQNSHIYIVHVSTSMISDRGRLCLRDRKYCCIATYTYTRTRTHVYICNLARLLLTTRTLRASTQLKQGHTTRLPTGTASAYECIAYVVDNERTMLHRHILRQCVLVTSSIQNKTSVSQHRLPGCASRYDMYVLAQANTCAHKTHHFRWRMQNSRMRSTASFIISGGREMVRRTKPDTPNIYPGITCTFSSSKSFS